MHAHYACSLADMLCQSLETTDPSVSVRLNMRKVTACMTPEQVSSVLHHLDAHYDAVPWCPHAWYLPQRPSFTFDPLLHAGAYYVQEASSMYVAEVLRRYLPLTDETPSSPLAALDLCAAPGGKSTLLAGLLPQGSLLVSNEVMHKRAHVLAENMTKWTSGMPDTSYPVTSLVTNSHPSDFAAFASQFDLLLTDVPCSGEGMFRKDEQAIRDWSLHNVELCRQRQRDILQDILPVLRPGGLLIYSTCTFNHYEDEENARYACQLLGENCWRNGISSLAEIGEKVSMWQSSAGLLIPMLPPHQTLNHFLTECIAICVCSMTAVLTAKTPSPSHRYPSPTSSPFSICAGKPFV